MLRNTKCSRPHHNVGKMVMVQFNGDEPLGVVEARQMKGRSRRPTPPPPRPPRPPPPPPPP